MARYLALLLVAVSTSHHLAAQEPRPTAQRLERLLHELSAVGADAWQQRRAAIEAERLRALQTAAERHKAAANLLAEAAAAEAEARRLGDELQRLERLQELVQQLAPPPATPAAPPAAAPETPPAATPMAAPATAAAAPADLVLWAAVEPLLQDRCAACHEPADQKGGLDVTSFAALRRGGSSGRTLVPGEPEQSRLYTLVARLERPFMPRGEDPLADAQVALLRRWIEHGASDTLADAQAFVAARQQAAAAEPEAGVPPLAGPMPHGLPATPILRPAWPGPLRALVRSPTAPLLALGGYQQVLLFDHELAPLGVLPLADEQLGPLAFAADGTLLAAACGAAGRSGRAALFDVATGQLVATVGAERDLPLAVAVHAGRRLAALGGAAKHTALLPLGGGPAQILAHDDFVLALQFSPDGALLAAGDRSGAVRLWETDGGLCADTLRGHRGSVHAVAFAPLGKRLFTAGADGTVRAFNPANGKQVWQQDAHQGQALALAVAADGRIATAGSDGRIAVFDSSGKLLGRSPACGDWLYAVAFGRAGEDVLAGDWQGRLHTFRPAEPRRVMPVTAPLGAEPPGQAATPMQ